MSFDEVRDSLVISFAEGLITYEEFLFLYEEYEPVNLFYRYWEFEPFCLDSLDSRLQGTAEHYHQSFFSSF